MTGLDVYQYYDQVCCPSNNPCHEGTFMLLWPNSLNYCLPILPKRCSVQYNWMSEFSPRDASQINSSDSLPNGKSFTPELSGTECNVDSWFQSSFAKCPDRGPLFNCRCYMWSWLCDYQYDLCPSYLPLTGNNCFRENRELLCVYNGIACALDNDTTKDVQTTCQCNAVTRQFESFGTNKDPSPF